MAKVSLAPFSLEVHQMSLRILLLRFAIAAAGGYLLSYAHGTTTANAMRRYET